MTMTGYRSDPPTQTVRDPCRSRGALARPGGGLQVRRGGWPGRSGEKWEASVQVAVVSPGTISRQCRDTVRPRKRSSPLRRSPPIERGSDGYWRSQWVRTGRTRDSRGCGQLIAHHCQFDRSHRGAGQGGCAVHIRLPERAAFQVTDSFGQPTDHRGRTYRRARGLFESELTLSLDPDLANIPDELFIRTESEVGSPLVLPIARSAGQDITVNTTLGSVMTLLISLEDATGTQLDRFDWHHPRSTVILPITRH